MEVSHLNSANDDFMGNAHSAQHAASGSVCRLAKRCYSTERGEMGLQGYAYTHFYGFGLT